MKKIVLHLCIVIFITKTISEITFVYLLKLKGVRFSNYFVDAEYSGFQLSPIH